MTTHQSISQFALQKYVKKVCPLITSCAYEEGSKCLLTTFQTKCKYDLEEKLRDTKKLKLFVTSFCIL